MSANGQDNQSDRNDPIQHGSGQAGSQRRIRHISAIQIRNLTPFPVRDAAFASALSQPAEHSQFTAQGNLSDDLDVTLTRRRSRRISASSVNILRGSRFDEVEDSSVKGGSDGKGRRRTHSKVSFSSVGSLARSSGTNDVSHPLPANTGVPTIRPTNRPRTNSMVSMGSAHIHGIFPGEADNLPPSTSSIFSYSSFVVSHSQRSLEKVIKSRLVETFITITIPTSPDSSPTVQKTETPSKENGSRLRPTVSPPSTPTHQPSSATPRKGLKSSSSHILETSKGATPPRRGSSASTRLSSSVRASPMHTRSASTSAGRPSGKLPSSPPLSQAKSADSASSPPGAEKLESTTPVPNYLSPIHRPSTNPYFPIDAKSKYEFTEWTDLSADKLCIQLWIHQGNAQRDDDNGRSSKGKGKGKERDNTSTATVRNDCEWKMLEEWNVALSDLVPLTNELESHPSFLPSNTLVFSFSASNQKYYYLPSLPKVRSRSPSPSAGYNTDPETDVRRLGQTRENGLSPPSTINTHDSQSHLIRHSRHSGKHRGLSIRTLSWQDLLQLVTLQACIVDTDKSLADIIARIDTLMIEDSKGALRRETSEREVRIQDRRAETEDMDKRSDHLRQEISARKEKLRQRKETLNLAKELHNDDVSYASSRKEEVTEELNRLTSLRSRFSPTRTTLISTLSFIFPIDLLSPPDLLFTILSVPLPIPIFPTDPAPPLTLPSHKEVTEDAVATALGYAAQVVQLLAAYLGKGLVYPVTCIGSRSLIKDNISAMVGPKMFPLFSKGVDTYRFEYGVFLLNKNIEMLMSDRDLRALDMRHTLPNLKNLLLTLTDGEGARLAVSQPPDSPILSGLETPPRAQSPPALKLTPSSPDGESSHESAVELPQENSSPVTSGSATPTAAAATNDSGTFSKYPYPKISLGFPPLPGFLRSRNPSTSRPSDPPPPAIPETSTEVHQNGSASTTEVADERDSDESNSDDDDHRTIQGVSIDAVDEADPAIKESSEPPYTNGVTANGEAHQEKVSGEGVSSHKVPAIVAHSG